MRAAVVTRFGGPEVFELAELPDPVLGPGQVAWFGHTASRYYGIDGPLRTREVFGWSLERSNEWLLAQASAAVLRSPAEPLEVGLAGLLRALEIGQRLDAQPRPGRPAVRRKQLHISLAEGTNVPIASSCRSQTARNRCRLILAGGVS
jgi:hypothetical protein